MAKRHICIRVPFSPFVHFTGLWGQCSEHARAALWVYGPSGGMATPCGNCTFDVFVEFFHNGCTIEGTHRGFYFCNPPNPHLFSVFKATILKNVSHVAVGSR